jgi:hypothetical protein
VVTNLKTILGSSLGEDALFRDDDDDDNDNFFYIQRHVSNDQACAKLLGNKDWSEM